MDRRSARRAAGSVAELPSCKPHDADVDRAKPRYASSSLAAEREAAKEESVRTRRSRPPNRPRPSTLVDSAASITKRHFGDRALYRVGGLEKNNGLEVLKITLRIS